MAIHILDQSTVNKIAAGEVIERPASALKELLENSADSGASRIEIDFDGGGKKELKVTDNGRGIEPGELNLALHPHATSKITRIEDLSSLKTFGFRGEALASLAAVSRLSIHSSQALGAASEGGKIVSHGGHVEPVVPAAPIGGTQVAVRDLFFNVPARQKFLKSDAGETAAIKKTTRAFALSHPEISVTLRQNGKVAAHWEKESFEKRACRVLELDRDQAVVIEKEEAGFKLRAIVGLPETHLPTQQGLWIFVQGRPVIDRPLIQAVMEGYRNLIMHHQYPRAVIYLEVDPQTVDVNVHPAKAQVKFSNGGAVFRFVSSEIKRALADHFEKLRGSGQPPVSSDRQSWPLASPSTAALSPAGQENLIRDAVTQYNRRAFQNPPTSHSTSYSEGEREQLAGGTGSPEGELLQTPGRISQPAIFEPNTSSNTNLAFNANLGVWSALQVVGQFSNTYIVCQSPKALILVDQHAAHERVLFERLKQQWSKTQPEKQPALLEDLVTLPRENIEALTEGRFAEVFEKLGFELIDRGPETLAVVSRPAFLIDVALKPLLERLSEQILEWGTAGLVEDLLTDLWASMACHGAIRAGRVLSREEMEALLRQMDDFAFSSFCPHGRPVSVQWTTADLEKLFKRIV